jgi:hypothetical protein
MLRTLRWALAVFLCLAQSASARSLPHEAYIWQHLWTPPVAAAVAGASDLFQGWRVLAAESDRAGHLRPVAVDWRALAGSAKPVIAVIRIDGQLAHWDARALLAQIHGLSAGWRSIAGIEIDYDCGTARLEDYGRFLTALRRQVPGRLSVTALPDWLTSPQLTAILAATDEVVLQVHAVRPALDGLFDAALARRWIDALDRRDAKPFRVALPDYSTRVVRDASGRIVAMESEMPRLVGGASDSLLLARPVAVAALLENLARTPPVHLAGFVWFRLPVAGDTHAWSDSTLRAVIGGKALRPHLAVVSRPDTATGARDIVLTDDAEVDAWLPHWIDLPRNCTAADGINGYSLGANGISLQRLKFGTLAAHHEQIVGWARCASAPEGFHVRE